MPEKDDPSKIDLEEWLKQTYDDFKNPIFIKKQELKEKRKKKAEKLAKKYGL